MKKTYYFIAWTLLFFILSVNVYCQVDTTYLHKTWNTFELGENLGGTNIWVQDFNGDGQNEILFGGGHSYSNSYFAIYAYSDGNYSPKWNSSLNTENYIRDIQVANFDNDEDYEIYILRKDGDLEVYDGATMDLQNTFSTGATEATKALFADIDKDGNVEYIVISNYSSESLFTYL